MEKAFYIKEIEAFVAKVINNRKELEFNPAEGKFQFSSEDYSKHIYSIDEFKTRHSTITEHIATS